MIDCFYTLYYMCDYLIIFCRRSKECNSKLSNIMRTNIFMYFNPGTYECHVPLYSGFTAAIVCFNCYFNSPYICEEKK